MTSITLIRRLLNASLNNKTFTKINLDKLKFLKIFNKKIPNNYDRFQSIRQFSTTPSKRSGIIPPLLWLIAKPLTKLSALIAGRGFRKWWMSLPESKRTIFWAHVRRNKFKYSFGIFGSSSSVIFYYQSHLQKTPITQRVRFIIFSSDQLSEIEQLEKINIFEKYKSKVLDIYSPQSHRALKVANRLFTANKQIPEVSAIDWKLTVIEAPIINAAAFPSGDLIVFTGLLDFVENDDELAIIMAHEMSHAVLQHAAEEISHSRLLDVISIGLVLIFWAILPTDLTAALTQFLCDRFLKFLFELPFSRQLEKEADNVGLSLAARACFDVRYSSVFWRRMEECNAEIVPEFLSTHPANETRAVDLDSLIPAALELRKECKCYDLPKEMILPRKSLTINKTDNS